jgi:hypothetical protein
VQVNDRSMTLKYFKPDDFHAVTGAQEEFRTHEPDLPEAVFQIGHRSKFFEVGQKVYCHSDGSSGVVDGIASEDGKPTQFVRVNTRLYHWTVLEQV